LQGKFLLPAILTTADSYYSLYVLHPTVSFCSNIPIQDFRPSLSVNTAAAVVSTRSDSVQSKQGRRLYKIALDTLVYNCPGELAPNVCCGGALGCAFESKEGLQNATLAYAYGPNNAIAGYKNIKCWDVSRITDMSNLFSSDMWRHAYDLSSYLAGFFDSFNEDISCWNTTSVASMDYMFSGAKAFNQPLASLDMSSIRSISHMFDGAESFSQDLCPWYNKITSTATTPVIGRVFDGTACPKKTDPNFSTKSSFCVDCPPMPASTNPPVPAPVTTSSPPIATPKPIAVTTSSPAISTPIPATCIAGFAENACCQEGIKTGCIFKNSDELKDAVRVYAADKQTGINTYGIIDCWDVIRITDASAIFNGLETFNEKLSCWDMSKVITTNSMFQGAIAFNQPLAMWNVSNVIDMMDMFGWARSFNQPLADWDVSRVKYMNSMFNGDLVFNQNLCPWYNKISPPYGTHDYMFLNSACMHQKDPDFTSKSHFCTACT